jgi:hypothetical protein
MGIHDEHWTRCTPSNFFCNAARASRADDDQVGVQFASASQSHRGNVAAERLMGHVEATLPQVSAELGNLDRRVKALAGDQFAWMRTWPGART